jgi:hypothetical protein
MACPVASFSNISVRPKNFSRRLKIPPSSFTFQVEGTFQCPPGGETTPLFLTIFEGTTPAAARPAVAISDADIIATVRSLLLERLVDEPTRKVVHLKPMPKVSRERGTRDQVGQER